MKCGSCEKECPVHAISFPDGEFTLDREKCNACLNCTKVCYSLALHPAAREATVQEIVDIVGKDMEYFRQTGGGMTISGGECLLHPEFTNALTDEAHGRGITVALDTSGYASISTLLPLAEKSDCLLYDIKAIDEQVHEKHIGSSGKLILDNLEILAADKRINPKLWIRMPLVGDVNDSDELMEKSKSFFVRNGIRRVSLLPYHELGTAKYADLGNRQCTFKAPSPERVEEIRQFFTAAGINADISGNSNL